MSLFPFNTNWIRRAQTDVPGLTTLLGSGVRFDVGSPVALSANGYVKSVGMGNKTYTLTATEPGDGTARNVTLARTAVDAADTPGKITVTGLDIGGNVITEDITPGATGVTVAGTKAFAKITSIVGSGWTTGGGADTIVVGWGNLLGLPDKLSDPAQVVAASFNGAREAVHPTVVVNATELALNTVLLATALDGSAVRIFYWV